MTTTDRGSVSRTLKPLETSNRQSILGTLPDRRSVTDVPRDVDAIDARGSNNVDCRQLHCMFPGGELGNRGSGSAGAFGTLLTAREVAGRLGVSTETALRWTRNEVLPGFRLPGGALRYREADIADWLAGRATSRQPPPQH